MKKIVLTMSLMAAMFFVSCDQNSADDEVQGGTSAYQTSVNSQAKLASLLAADCENPVSDSAVVTKALTGSSGDYCVWNTTTKTIGAVSVQFEGMYGSGIRPTTAGWYVGVVDAAATCSTWDSWKGSIAVKNDISLSYVGTSPACTSVIIPENVVSAHGNVGTLNFGLGYYTYASQAFSITKKIVIWKDKSATSATAITDPANDATEAYLIEVTSIVPTFGTPPFYGTVSYTYTKVL